MLSKVCFDRCMNTLLTFCEVGIDKEKNRVFYELMKNDFEDVEFSCIAENICKTELLYGKYPAPKMFYDRKEPDKSKMVPIIEGQFFIDDTMPEYKPYLIGMSDEDIEGVWKWIFNNKYGQEVSKDWIIERIKQFRKPIVEEVPAIEGIGLSSAIKRIEG